MDVILELLKLIDLFMNASLTTQILASIFLLPRCAVKPRPSGRGYKARFST